MLIGHHIFPSFPQSTFWPCHWLPHHMVIYNSQIPNYHFRKQVTLYHFILSKSMHNNERLQYKFVKLFSVLSYLIVYIIIFYLCKVFLSLQSCFVRLVFVLETIKVHFHSSTLYHLVDLQQWSIYSLMLSLSSVSSAKLQLFHESYLFSPCKYICLCICNLIIYSCVPMCK